ncbi:hypothetical protein F2Q69_00063857 [Brassica cretica]|uniref:Uncharacterized protein n=1 Tax=Brassica cretica TaxID=69181 RepID=A0A8S9RB95_BRACR|nr:hypothetical protein F2Q69_00063857 [Brassica cretica]
MKKISMLTIRLVFGDPGGKTINGAINVVRKTLRNSYLTGSAGIEAALDLMKANIARKEASEGLKPFSAFVPAGYGSRRDLVDGELTHHDKVYARKSPLLLSRTKGVCVRSFDILSGLKPFSAFVPAGYGSRRDLVDGELTHHDKVYARKSPLLLSRTKGVCVRSFDVRCGPRP